MEETDSESSVESIEIFEEPFEPSVMPGNLPMIPTVIKEDSFKSCQTYCGTWRVNNAFHTNEQTSPAFMILNMYCNLVCETNIEVETFTENFIIYLNYIYIPTGCDIKKLKCEVFLSDDYKNTTDVEFTEFTLVFGVCQLIMFKKDIKIIEKTLRDCNREFDFVEIFYRIEVIMGPIIDIRDQLLIKRYQDPWIFLDILSEHSLNLLRSDAMSDIILKCDEHDLKAHKLILAVRSRKFAELINNNVDALYITDMDLFTLRQVLYYIYSGKIPVIPVDKMNDLYTAGHLYGMDELKKGCASWMILNWEPRRLREYVTTVAEGFSDEWFKTKAFLYLTQKGL